MRRCWSAAQDQTVRFALINVMKFAISVLALAAACLAQEGLTIDNKHKERVPTREVEQIYFSACSGVRQEFDLRRPILPRVKLVLGADKNEVRIEGREIRLTRWDRYAFAQGVVWLAFEGIMPSEQRLTIAKRALIWMDSTVEVERLAK
jgi:hypothetical protein